MDFKFVFLIIFFFLRYLYFFQILLFIIIIVLLPNSIFLLVLGFALSASLLYAYQSHIEDVDLLGIKRKRFIALSSKQMEKLGDFEFQQVRFISM